MAEEVPMATFVLVHGAWHGGWCWQRLTPSLTSRGHAVYAPTLTGLGERAHLRGCVADLATHIEDVVSVVESEDLTDVVLVGHSLGGIKLPAIAERIVERVVQLVNVDGMIPLSGQSIKDMLPGVWESSRARATAAGDEGWVPPPDDWDFGLSPSDYEWAKRRLSADPIKTWESPIVFTSERAGRLPGLFIHCTSGLAADEVVAERETCEKRGWQYRALVATHDVMLSAPEQLAATLLTLV
jgi:alpha-beta hydrolase superfamily lysophospholipase